MGRNETASEPDAFAMAVRQEILAELGRRGVSPNSLSKTIGRGTTYINARLRNAYKELSLNDIEAICRSLDLDVNDLMGRAIKAYKANTQ